MSTPLTITISGALILGIERQGSGLGKIIDAYQNAYNYTPDMEPTFFSNRAQFTVTLRNLNIGVIEANSEANNEANYNVFKAIALDILSYQNLIDLSEDPYYTPLKDSKILKEIDTWKKEKR